MFVTVKDTHQFLAPKGPEQQEFAGQAMASVPVCLALAHNAAWSRSHSGILAAHLPLTALLPSHWFCGYRVPLSAHWASTKLACDELDFSWLQSCPLLWTFWLSAWSWPVLASEGLIHFPRIAEMVFSPRPTPPCLLFHPHLLWHSQGLCSGRSTRP